MTLLPTIPPMLDIDGVKYSIQSIDMVNKRAHIVRGFYGTWIDLDDEMFKRLTVEP